MAAEIALITGLPGAGKTSLAVDLMETDYKGRLLFVDGITDLSIEHHEIDVLNWHNDAPDGCVIFVDEVQRKWRPTGPGAKIHPSIEALETHRHRGIDIVLMTQNPKLVHTNVRNLVNRHLHILNTKWKGRYLYEWAECNVNLAYSSCLNVRAYKLPKSAFAKYKSASVHIKSPLRIPPKLYLLGILICILVFLAYSVYSSFSKRTEKPVSQEANVASAPTGNILPALTGQPSSAGPQSRPFNLTDFIPRVTTHPESAAAYDDIRKVQQFPVVAGGVCFKGECKCFTQQGTNAGLSHADCLTAINNPRFDAYSAPAPVQQAQSKTAPPVDQATANSPEIKHAVAVENHTAQQAVTRAARTAQLVTKGSL